MTEPVPDRSASILPGNGETILLVEDDAQVREFSASALAHLGYCVLEASEAGAALNILAERSEIALHRAARHRPPLGSGSDPMTVLLVCWLHPFAGTSRSRRRTRFIPTPASAGRASPIRPQTGRRVWQQRSLRDHQQLPAHGDLRKTIAPQSRCRVKSP
jgi:CheY-like chemotaxis protein